MENCDGVDPGCQQTLIRRREAHIRVVTSRSKFHEERPRSFFARNYQGYQYIASALVAILEKFCEENLHCAHVRAEVKQTSDKRRVSL